MRGPIKTESGKKVEENFNARRTWIIKKYDKNEKKNSGNWKKELRLKVKRRNFKCLRDLE
jgi:hypothetical protein